MKKLSNIIVFVIAGLTVVFAVLAFTGPNNQPPIGNPAFWAKNGNDVYYNVTGGNVGIGINGPAYKLDVQNGQINSSGGLCIAGTCKTDWNQITGTNYWTLNGSNLYPNLTSYLLGVGTVSIDSNYKITTSGGGIKAESTNQPAGYFSSASGYGLIVNSGNVGIGTANPGVKLEVAGNTKISGNLEVTGSINGGIPSGAVMPFNLASCPSGWVLADGTGGTPDLRGTFIRGMYGDQNGRDVARALGSYQEDEFKSHRHTQSMSPDNTGGSNTAEWNNYDNQGTTYTGYTGGTETRPKNVALIYCVKM